MRPIDPIERLWAKKKVPRFEVGDTVDVHVRIVEGDRERVQVFSGTVIARRGQGVTETFTVRRIVGGEGMERIFPIHSPRIVDIRVRKRGRVRRAKLHYLRERVGRATKVAERTGGDREPAAEPEAKPAGDAQAAAEPQSAASPAPQPEPQGEAARKP